VTGFFKKEPYHTKLNKSELLWTLDRVNPPLC